MTDQIPELMLQIDAPALDENELNDLTGQLQDRIDQLEIESVERVKGDSLPEGAMPIDWVVIGTLAIKLTPIVIPPLIATLKAWVDRRSQESTEKEVKLKIELGSVKFQLDRSTSHQQLINLEKDLQHEMERG